MVFCKKEFASTPTMEGGQTPLPIFEDSGTAQNHISSSDHRSPSPIDDTISQEVFVSPPPINNGNPDGIDEFMNEESIDKEYFDSLPPGYRFCPTDSDLIVYYLQKKIDNNKLPRNQIRHVNLYLHSPEEISGRYPPVGEKEWYFFTPRDRKYRNGSRPNRAAGSGYWKATGADRPVTHRGLRVGSRKALVYYEGKPPKGSKTNWIMHEYRVDASPRAKTSLTDMRLDDFVLCRIYKKIDKSFQTRPRNEDPEASFQTRPRNEDPEALDPTIQGTEMFDPHGSASLSDMATKNDLHARSFDKELKELEASAELMQSQFNNGFSDIHSMHVNAASFSRPAKFYSNFQIPINCATKPLCFRPSMCNPESTFTSKYLNEASLEIKPRVIHDNIGNIKDYDNCTLSSDLNLAAVLDFSTPVEPLQDLDNLINKYSGNSYETSTNTLDSPPIPKGYPLVD